MLSKEISDIIIASGHAAPSADNSQPWLLTWLTSENKLILSYDKNRVAGLTFPADSPATLLTMGCVIENIYALTQKYGLAPQIKYCDITSEEKYAEISFSSHNHLPDEAYSHPIFKRHTNRFSYLKSLQEHNISHITHFTEQDARVSLYSAPGTKKCIAKLAQSASEIRFQTKEVHEWLAHSLRFTKEDADKGNGLDLKTLDLPPAGGLFLKFIADWKNMYRLNKIGAYKILSKIDSTPLRKAPCIIAITGKNTKQGAIDAGRLLCRTWTELNQLNLAVHPYFVISDQLIRLKENQVPEHLVEQAKEIEAESKTVFSLADDENLYMLLRVGTPKSSPLKSKRLPVSHVFQTK